MSIMNDTQEIDDKMQTQIEYFEREDELNKKSCELEIVSNCDLGFGFSADTDWSIDINPHFAVAVFKHETNPFTEKEYSYIFFHICEPSTFIDAAKFIIRRNMKLGEFIGFRLLNNDRISRSELEQSLIQVSYLYNNPNSSRNMKYEYGKFIKNILDRKSRKLVQLARKLTKGDFTKVNGETLKINKRDIESAWFWSTVHKNVKHFNTEYLENLEKQLSKKIIIENTLDAYF